MRFRFSRAKGIIFLVLAAGIVFGVSHIVFGHMARKTDDSFFERMLP